MTISMAQGRCPASGSESGSCPASRSSSRMGPRGCAFSGAFQPGASQSLYGAPQGPDARAQVLSIENKTMVEILLPNAPPKDVSKSLKNADSLCPNLDDVLAAALGAPARRVLMRAETLGPRTGYRDGYLSGKWGFCPSDPSASPIALAACPGRVWSDLCSRMPGIVGRGRMREAILELPTVQGTADVIPDEALWASTVCLGILASVYRYEERNDGHEGISTTASPFSVDKALLMQEDEVEEELVGIPRNIAIPFRVVCTRMGRPLPHLTQYDVSIYNFKLRDHTSVYPYVQRAENMDLRWPVFNDRAEAMFLLCMAEVHGCFTPGVEIVARCQEMVMDRDNDGLLRELIKLKEIIDQLGYVFHKISVNPGSGEQFANPVEWGQRYAKFSAPLSKRVPALSGLALPLFQLMDGFLGRKKYDTFLGLEALHLRAWLPLNHRAFIAAIEQYYSIPDYVASSGDKRLIGVLDGIVESYAGERGFMGTHRYKVYGFLEVVAKTGRSETNGGAGAGDNDGRPWEEVHRTLSDSMIERLEPFRSKITLKPHEMRGCFEECRFKAKIASRDFIDNDRERSTGKITIDLSNTGMTYGPGDRLAIMPLNSWKEVTKVAQVLGIMDRFDDTVPLEGSDIWKRYSRHEAAITRNPRAGELTLRDILRKGHLAPLTKETVMAVHLLLRASSSTILKVLSSDTWPISGSLGDLLEATQSEVPNAIWDKAFDIDDLSWLPKLIPIEVPRTYSISSYSNDLLPSSINLTVSRVEHKLCPLLAPGGAKDIARSGVSSGFLNPHPEDEQEDHLTIPASIKGNDQLETVLVGISRPLNFQLPISPAAPVAMFAGGSGIAPFRGFWQARIDSGAVGRNILFLGVQSRKKLVYEEELRDHVRYDGLELHTAFSRDKNGLAFDMSKRDLVEKETEPRYLDSIIVEKGNLVCDLVMSTKMGGLGGYLYVCGSVSVYETVISGIQKAIYQNRTVTKKSADALLATAFAERRFMLDIFMTPRAMSFSEPVIPISALSRHTGHRENSKTWIGVHGGVYDVTDFLPIHPGGSLIVAASAGLDASKTFDDLAHTTNPEVMSLLSKYFIGYLAPKPQFQTPELSSLYDGWLDYLRTCVEGLTTLSFEVKSIMADTNVWFNGGMLNMGGVRKFYQFQSRLLQNGFTTLFGPKLQELYVKLSFSLVSAHHSGARLPDVMGIVARAQSSAASTAAQKEIAQVGEFVCESSAAQSFERGIIQYAQAVTELDVRFLEQIREEICTGMDAFELAMSMKGAAAEKQRLIKLAAFLVSILERIAERLDTFFVELSAQSPFHPEIEDNPSRARWNLVKRRITDGSFFLYTQELTLDENEFFDSYLDAPEEGSNEPLQSPYRPLKVARMRQSISFDQVINQANDMVKKSLERDLRDNNFNNNSSSSRDYYPSVPEEDTSSQRAVAQQQQQQRQPRPPRRLAEAHSRRAEDTGRGASSYETHLDRKAAHRMSTFISGNLKAIRRLSRVAMDSTSLDHAMSMYGGGNSQSTSSTRHVQSQIPHKPSPPSVHSIASEARARSRSRSGAPSSGTRLDRIPSSDQHTNTHSRGRSINMADKERERENALSERNLSRMPTTSGGGGGGGPRSIYAGSVRGGDRDDILSVNGNRRTMLPLPSSPSDANGVPVMPALPYGSSLSRKTSHRDSASAARSMSRSRSRAGSSGGGNSGLGSVMSEGESMGRALEALRGRNL